MELILKQTVDTLGEEGDIVKVKDGYARNYLIPQKIAVLADKANRSRLAQGKATIETRKEEQRQAAESLSKKLSGTTVVIAQRVGEGDRLFGSVTTADIAAKLAELGIKVDRKKIQLAEPIKAIGDTKVQIKVGYQMVTDIIVQVVPQETE